MLIRKIFLSLNNYNTIWNLHLDIMIQIFVAHNLFFFLYRNIARSGSLLKMVSPTKRSSYSMTVMLLRIMKSLNISSAVCCCLKKSSWSILFWNTISTKAPMELKTESMIITFRMNFSRKSWNDVLHASLMETRKRIHQWFLISPPSSSSTSSR